MADQASNEFSNDFQRDNVLSHGHRMTDVHNAPSRVFPQQVPPVSHAQAQYPSKFMVIGDQHTMQIPVPSPQQLQNVSSAQLLQAQETPEMFSAQDCPSQDTSFQRIPRNDIRNPLTSPSTKPVQREINVGKLLISLAEEYFEAAHKIAPYTIQTLASNFVEKYQKLVATGLACLEVALKRVPGLDPRDEACIRLRYASVLFEETENAMEAETTLSKGIELCERNHYYDLKYAMTFILAQCVAKSNLKASIKVLDGYISEADTFSNVPWVYAFRFLRASHSLACGTFIDNNAAVRNLRAITALAEQHGDRPIRFAASLMEVIAHLRMTGPEASQNLKSSMASVWSHQTEPSCQIPPLIGLAHILDLACSIKEGDTQVLMTKLQAARIAMDASIRSKDWGSRDIISIPIRNNANYSHFVSPDTGMILRIGNDGVNLMMTLLHQKDAYCISCLLYGITLFQRSAYERLPAVKYLNQGLSLLEKEDDPKTFRSFSNCILPNLVAKRQWRGQVLCYIRIYLAFCHTLDADWLQVKTCLEELQKTIENFQLPLKRHLESLLFYLSGTFYQGSGDLDTALEIYQDPRFKITTEKSSNISSTEQIEHDLAILAGLNALLILQEPKRFDPVRNSTMLNILEPLCLGHTNQDIVNAFNLIMVTVKTDPPKTVMEIKHHLSAALNGTKKTSNSQLLSITVNLMFSIFFVGVIGTQAENSAQAASRTAAKSGNPLWMSIANRMLARCYELHGKTENAQAAMEISLKSAEKIPLQPE